jgi:hypothetical protein
VAHIRKLGERRYQARWVDPDGRECSKIFSRRTDAEDKIKEVEHSKLDGSYVDHKNPITVAQYAKQWSATRPHRSTTATRVKSMIDNHIAGTRLGGRRLSAVRTSEVQAWVTERSRASVVAVAERLGHENATLVLKTYGHLMPDAEDRTRRAIDDAWTRDGTQTESDHG